MHAAQEDSVGWRVKNVAVTYFRALELVLLFLCGSSGEEDGGAEGVESWSGLNATTLLALRKLLVAVFDRIVDFCCDVRVDGSGGAKRCAAEEELATIVASSRAVLSLWTSANSDAGTAAMHPRLYQLEGWRTED